MGRRESTGYIEELPCPVCGEWIPAGYDECLSCGSRFEDPLDPDGDAEDEEEVGGDVPGPAETISSRVRWSVGITIFEADGVS